jgi:ABC-type Fe3+/spermidine/putrescine transport system ATPase subunit
VSAAPQAQPTLRCSDLRMRYPDQPLYALGSDAAGVSLEIARGELFALLGPSGCGKTTMLRIVGGFLRPTTGRVEIDGTDVTHRQPYERPTNTVFQSYALFPHMRVGANVAYGLKMERVPRAERQRRMRAALALVGLDGMERRRISELSGGQQQRTALARALVKRPALLLLDEPFGALDLQVRRQMQDELVRIKQSTHTTLVHVTHDQEEACAIADRIAVMSDGAVVQVDTPEALYQAPRTSYVARFIDAGTVIRGAATRRGDVVDLAHRDVLVRGTPSPSLAPTAALAALLPRTRVRVGAARDDADGANHVRGTVERLVFTGSVFTVHVRAGEGLELRASLPIEEVAALGEERLRPGSGVDLHWRPEDVVFVEDADGPATASAA